MRLLDVKLEQREGRLRLSGVMEDAAGKPLPDLWFEYGAEWRDFVRADADVFLPTMLIVSMIRGEALETSLPVSKRMARAIPTIQAIFGAWHPETLTVLPVELPNREDRPRASSAGAGSFFSAGADAFYTVLKTRGRVDDGHAPTTHLIHMTGIETALSNTRTGKESQTRALAEELGLPVIVGRTNLRDCFDYLYLDFICGPALASIALSLSAGLSLVRIPLGATYQQKDLGTQSSHPMVDFHWSTEYLDIVLHGGEVTRAEKIEYLAQFPLVLENLSVCTRNYGDFENCGRCPKCIGTMIVLQAIGVLENCPTLPSPFDYSLASTVNLDDPTAHGFWLDYLAFIRRKGRDPRLLKILERLVSRHAKYRALVRLVSDTPLHPPARWLRQFVKDRLNGRRK